MTQNLAAILGKLGFQFMAVTVRLFTLDTARLFESSSLNNRITVATVTAGILHVLRMVEENKLTARI